MPDGKKRRRIGFRIFLAVLILLYASLILALQSRTFADFYCVEIAPRIANAVGGVMSLIPTAVCEISIAALVCFALIFVILLILLPRLLTLSVRQTAVAQAGINLHVLNLQALVVEFLAELDE